MFQEAYNVRGVDEIKTELMTNGPMEVSFDVYEDFMTYKSGIYQQVTGKYLGGHAVKLVGWGVENGVEYWKIANSWNEDWGENGYFRIKMGECRIESDVVCGLPQLCCVCLEMKRVTARDHRYPHCLFLRSSICPFQPRVVKLNG